VSGNGFSYPRSSLAKEVEIERPQVKSLLRCNLREHSWKEADEKAPVALKAFHFIHADPTVPDVLGLKVVAGNWESITKTNLENCVALTESFARKEYGGDDDVIGHEAYIEGIGTVTVLAVIEDLPTANSITDFEPVAGWLFCKNDKFLSSGWGPAFVKLKEGTDPDAFISSLTEDVVGSDGNVTKKYCFTDGSGDESGVIDAARRCPMRKMNGLFKTMLISLPGILILIVALFNYFHLLVNSILSSRREYALRRVHGARTFDMWLMVGTQILVVTLLTGILSLIIARYVAPLISVSESRSAASITTFCINTSVIVKHTVQYIVMLMVVGLLIAWLAVKRVRNTEMSNMVKRSYGGRNIMLGVQLAVAQIMVSMLVAIFLKMRANLTEPYSWLSKEDKTCIITDMIYNSDRTYAESLLSYLKSQPYVTHAVLSFTEYLRGTKIQTEFEMNGWDDNKSCSRVFIDEEMMDMLGLKIKDGRAPAKTNEIMVDDGFIGRFGLGIGDTIRVMDFPSNYPDAGLTFNGENSQLIPLVIVGHVDNILDKTTFTGAYMSTHQPAIYLNWPNLSGFVVVRCLPGHQKETKAAIARFYNPDLENVDDYSDYMSTSLYQYLDENNQVWNSIGFILWTVAIIAFIITLLGVYSAISVDTTRRRREMAVRKINGARTGQITMLFVNLYVKLFIISSVFSVPVTAMAIKFFILNNRPFEKGPLYAILFYLFIYAIMVAFVALTIGFKIHRISRDNPADVVKSE